MQVDWEPSRNKSHLSCLKYSIMWLKRLESRVQLPPSPPSFQRTQRNRVVPSQSAFSPLLSAAWLKIAVSIAPDYGLRYGFRPEGISNDLEGVRLFVSPLSV
jgi:hypothetical protein